MSDTFFQSGLGGGGGGSSDYIKDSFQDTTLLPSNNTGLGSTLSNNPLGFMLGNSDVALYRTKTLLFSGLNPVTDRTKWINGNATYEVVFDREFPSVKAYATGSPRITKTPYGTAVNIQFTGDMVGVNAKAVRMGWIIAPIVPTGTAAIFTDGVDTTRTATFGGAALGVSPVGYNTQYTVWHEATDETDSLHDFRLVANQFGTLNVVGIILYFQNASGAIVQSSGDSYIDKEKISTAVGTTLSAPASLLETGYRADIFKFATGAYGLTAMGSGVTLTTFGNGAASGTSVDV